MGQANREIGQFGEAIAKKFLISRKYAILDRNFFTPFGEIDIVAENKGCLVFVEVKTRISKRFGPPLASIDGIKRKRIIRNCQYYLKRYGLFGKPCRVDVIAIRLDKKRQFQVLKHVRNAIKEKEV